MTPQAIAKLRRTFIAVATASFFLVIVLMGAATLCSSIISIRGQANSAINAILDAGGKTPTEENYHGGVFHEEASYGLRFFTIAYNRDGEVVDVDLSHVSVVDRDEALETAKAAGRPSMITGLGQSGNYFYKESPTEDGRIAVFLDCSLQLTSMWEIIIQTMGICFVAFVLTFIVVVLASKRAIRPEIENAQRQQKFMTNASHELKTPIAVIRANTELTEMISGETEWTQSTLSQVDRLDGLVKDLMDIVSGEENASSDQSTAEIDVSEVVKKATESFNSVAQQNGKGLESSIAEGVKLRGSESSIEQLTCLLVDNAIKYCDADGTVKVRLSPAIIGRGCTLAVSNEYADGANVDYSKFFERFYREDESHENQQGYGIGLSVAESICKRYRGSIKASWKAGVITFTCVLKDA